MSGKIVTLVFTNADAIPTNTKIVCSKKNMHNIMHWYGAYFDGDHYTVSCDGIDVPMKVNGVPLEPPELCPYCAGTGVVFYRGEPSICLACSGDTVDK